jgi:hypothetical protein
VIELPVKVRTKRTCVASSSSSYICTRAGGAVVMLARDFVRIASRHD